MDDRRIVFDAEIGDYVDSECCRPPSCMHSASCLSKNGNLHARQKYYTLPLSCIRNNCKIDKWSLVSDSSHLQLQCGASLQLVLHNMLKDGIITIHQYYEVLTCFKNAVNENIGKIKDMKFSHKRSPPVKLSAKIYNYKNEYDKWIFFLHSIHISVGRLIMISPTMKVNMTKTSK